MHAKGAPCQRSLNCGYYGINVRCPVKVCTEISFRDFYCCGDPPQVMAVFGRREEGEGGERGGGGGFLLPTDPLLHLELNQE